MVPIKMIMKRLFRNKLIAYCLLEFPLRNCKKLINQDSSCFLNNSSEYPFLIFTSESEMVPWSIYRNLKKLSLEYKSIAIKHFNRVERLAYIEKSSIFSEHIEIFGALPGIIQADIFRVIYIYENGGLYLDLKSYVSARILKVIGDKNGFFISEPFVDTSVSLPYGLRISNWGFGFRRGDQFLGALISYWKDELFPALSALKIAERRISFSALDVWQMSGPVLWTNVLVSNKHLIPNYVYVTDGCIIPHRYQGFLAWSRSLISHHYALSTDSLEK